MELAEKFLQEELTPEQYERFCRIREEHGMETAVGLLPDMGNGEMYCGVNSRIKAIRVHHGLTQTEVATILNLSQREYWRYEQEGYSPNILKIGFLAMFYNVTLDWFAGLVADPRPMHKSESSVNGYTLSSVKKAKAEGRKIEPIS